MRVYAYTAFDADGQKRRGRISGENETRVRAQLSASRLLVLDLRRCWFRRTAKYHAREFESFAQQLQLMLRAEVGLIDALTLIAGAEQSPDESLAKLLAERISEGQKLSDVATSMPEVFGRLAPALFAVGERTGELVEAVHEVHRSLEEARQSRQRLQQALIYPLTLGGMLIAMSILMLLWVVPDMVQLLTSLNAELPWVTLQLLALSQLLENHGGSTLMFLSVLPLCLAPLFLNAGIRHRVAGYALKVPLLGRLLLELNLLRFSRGLGALLKSQVNLLEALATARSILGFNCLRDGLILVESDVLAGSSLSRALRQCPYFPEQYSRLLEVGESAGSLESMLQHLADLYDLNIRTTIRRLEVWGGTALLVLIGAMLLGIVAAVLGPLYGSFANIEF